MMFMGFVVSLLFRNYRMAAKPFSVKSPTTNTRWNRVVVRRAPLYRI
jgi:hypothetical protein